MESFQVLFLAPIRLFLAVVLVIIEKDDVVVFRRVIKILKLINKKMKGSESKHLKVSHSSKIIRELKRRIVLDKMGRKETTEDAYSLIDKYFPYIRIHPNKQTLKERRDGVDRFQTQEVREQLLSIVCRNEYRHHEVPSAEKKFLVQLVKNYVREVNDDLAPTKIEQLSSHNGRFHCDVHDFFNNGNSERKGIYKRLVSLCMAGPPSEKDLYSLLREIWNEDGPKRGRTRRRKLRGDEEVEELDNVGENLDGRREEEAEDLQQGAVFYQGDISTPTCSENGVRSRQIADSLYLKIMKEVMESDNEAGNEETRRSRVFGRSDLSNRSKDLDQSMEQSYCVTQDRDRDFIESAYPSRSGIRSRRQSPHARSDVPQPRTSTLGADSHRYQTRKLSPGGERDYNQSRTPSPGVFNDRHQPRRHSPRDLNRSRGQSPDGHSRALNQSGTPSPKAGNHLGVSRTSLLDDGSHCNHARKQSPDANNHCTQSNRHSIYESRVFNESSNQAPVISINLKSRRQSPKRQAPDNVRNLKSSRQSPRRQAPDDIRDLIMTPDIRELGHSRRQSPRRQAPDGIVSLNESSRQSPRRQAPDDIRDLIMTPDIRDLGHSRRQSPRRQAPDGIVSLNESSRQSPRRQALNNIRDLQLAPNDIRDGKDSRKQSPGIQFPDDIRDIKTRRRSPRRQAPNDIRDLNESRRHSPRRQAPDDITSLNKSRRQSLNRQTPYDIRRLKSRRQSPRRQAPDDIINLDDYGGQSPRRQAPEDISLNESTCRRESPKRQAPNDIRDLNESRRHSPRRQAPDDITSLNKSRRQSLKRQTPDNIRRLKSRRQSPKRQAPDDISHLKSRRQSPRRQAPDDIINLDESKSQSPRSQAPNDLRDFNESRRQSLRKQPRNDISQDNHEGPDEDIEEPMDTDSDDFILVQGAACKQEQESSEMTLCRPRRCSVILKDCKDLCSEKLGEWNVAESLKVTKGHSPSNDLPSRQLRLPPCSIMKEFHTKGQGKGELSEVRQRSSPPRTEMSHTSFMAMLGLTPTSKVKVSDTAVINEVKQRSQPITNTDSPLGTLRLRRCSVVMVKLEVMEREEAENQTPVPPTISYSDQEEEDQNIPFIQDHDRVMEEEAAAFPFIIDPGQEIGDQSSSSFEDHNGFIKEAPVSPYIIDSDQEEGNQSTSFLLDHNGMMEGAPISCSVADSGQEVEDQATPFLQHDNGGTVEQAVKDLKRHSPQMNRLDLSRCARLRECSVRLRKYKKSAATHIRRLILRRVSGPSIFKIKNYVRMSIHIPNCGRVRLRQRLPASGLYM
ncbi:uncharacterized protein LOC129280144 isoform X2 [Lytechinus pictus]|uniref:uncharacterized protein LOC129280144 isoform X2 n=1 Tax=Lytechinus pictus TaxID=7653 RepID=UPI0030BA0147